MMKKVSIFSKLRNKYKIKQASVYIPEGTYSLIKTIDITNPIKVDLAIQYDKIGFMSEELGKELDRLFDDDYAIGIHRTGFTHITPYINDKTLFDMFNKGLYSNGHIMAGGNDGQNDIEKTVSFYNEFLIMNGAIKTCDNYKNSTGCLIIKIPKSYIGKKDGEIAPIFYRQDHILRLLPEFIYGYIPVSNHQAEQIIRNPNYKDNHYLVNDNFYYDSSVYYKAKRENRELFYLNPINNKLKYDILYKAYKDTLKKYNYNQALTALFSLINSNKVSYFTGNENKKNLSMYVAYNDIDSILSQGLGIYNQETSKLIDVFTRKVASDIEISEQKNHQI